MKIYDLIRLEDVSGVSGVGEVAEIVQFSNGKVAVAFKNVTEGPAVGVSALIVYDSIEDVQKIHGHEGRTHVAFRGEL